MPDDIKTDAFTTFVIHWQITGSMEIVAKSKEAAERQFHTFTVEELARQGDLESYPPEPKVVG